MRWTAHTGGMFVTAMVLVASALNGGEATPVAQTLPGSAVTFSKDIAPILQRSCQTCHRPDANAPMSLLTYEEARPWARSIKQKVTARDMPPWFIDRTIGIQKFKNDRSLSDVEIATIAKWVDAGAPQGNPADRPPPLKFADADAWEIGKPDLIIQMPVNFGIPATGSDSTRDWVVATGLTEDRWIKAIQTKPSKEAVHMVHHAVLYLVENEGGDSAEGDYLTEYGQGKNADILPEGTGRLLKANGKVRFNMHYHPIGEAVHDQTVVGFKLYPKGYVPQYYQIADTTAWSRELDIPANTKDVRFDGYQMLKKPTRISSYQPHMHQLGQAQCLSAILPDTYTEETISCVSRYNFAWQIAYMYDDDVAPLLPAGTMLHQTSWYNNTASNKWVVDPRNWVGGGSKSIDEMSMAHVVWTYLTEEDYKRMVAERNAKLKVNTDNQHNP